MLTYFQAKPETCKKTLCTACCFLYQDDLQKFFAETIFVWLALRILNNEELWRSRGPGCVEAGGVLECSLAAWSKAGINSEGQSHFGPVAVLWLQKWELFWLCFFAIDFGIEKLLV